MKITPAEGKVAIEFLEQDSGDSDALLALVIGVGPNTKGMKVGDNVLVTNGTKDYGTKIDEDTYVIYRDAVIGTVEE